MNTKGSLQWKRSKRDFRKGIIEMENVWFRFDTKYCTTGMWDYKLKNMVYGK